MSITGRSTHRTYVVFEELDAAVLLDRIVPSQAAREMPSTDLRRALEGHRVLVEVDRPVARNAGAAERISAPKLVAGPERRQVALVTIPERNFRRKLRWLRARNELSP
jgi:hypothetical protein